MVSIINYLLLRFRIFCTSNQKMENFWKQYCRICLGTINNEDFEKIHITQEILDILLLKMDLDKNKQITCKVCALKAMEAWKFKLMCLDTDNTIIRYVDHETGNSVDLLEIYAKENGNHQLMDTLNNHKVCRLCMQLIKGKVMSIHEVETDAIARYIPEINTSIIEDPVVCKECFESVGTHSSFIKNCLDIDEKIKCFYGNSGSYSPSWLLASDLCVKTENTVIKQELSEYEGECMENENALEILTSEDQYPIKTEYIDIKLEGVSESEAKLNAEDESADWITQGNFSQNSVEVDNNKQSFYEHASTLAGHQITLQEKHRFVHKDGMDQHDTRGRKSESHRSILETKRFKCDTCGYKTKEKGNLKKHMVIHKDISEIEVFECNTCGFKTKWRSSFKMHTLKYSHQGVIKNADKNYCSETRVFTCDTCDYKCKQKTYFQNHLLKHKNIFETEVFECDICDYKTKYKHMLKKHQLTYDDSTEFECYTCGHKTKSKVSIKQHMLKHKGFAETEVFTCDTCAYKTKYKYNLKQHQQIHKDNSEFECDTCGYRSERKVYLRMHLIMQPTHHATCCTSCST